MSDYQQIIVYLTIAWSQGLSKYQKQKKLTRSEIPINLSFYVYIDIFRNRWLPGYRSWTLGGVTIVRHYESVTIGCLH